MMMTRRVISPIGDNRQEISTKREFLIVCLLLISLSCDPQSSKNNQDNSELVVAAAANLTDFFAQVGRMHVHEMIAVGHIVGIAPEVFGNGLFA